MNRNETNTKKKSKITPSLPTQKTPIQYDGTSCDCLPKQAHNKLIEDEYNGVTSDPNINKVNDNVSEENIRIANKNKPK
jgi:hypothetical protein